jgi:hypothetical protein
MALLARLARARVSLPPFPVKGLYTGHTHPLNAFQGSRQYFSFLSTRNTFQQHERKK